MNINPFELMKQLGSIESQMKAMKEDLAKLTSTGSSGAGLVEVTVNGEYKVVNLSINPVIIDKNEHDTLEVLIQSAFNDATQKLKDIIEDYTRRKLAQAGIGDKK